MSILQQELLKHTLVNSKPNQEFINKKRKRV